MKFIPITASGRLETCASQWAKRMLTVFVRGPRVLVSLVLLLLVSCSSVKERPTALAGKAVDLDSPRYLSEIAQEHYEYKEYDQALFLYLKLVERFSSQKDRFEKELAWAHYEIGFIYLLQGRTNKARESFNRVLSDFSTLAPRTLAEERLAELSKKKNDKKS